MKRREDTERVKTVAEGAPAWAVVVAAGKGVRMGQAAGVSDVAVQNGQRVGVAGGPPAARPALRARSGQPTPKQFLDVAGRPLVAHTLDALLAHPRVEGAVVAIPRGERQRVEDQVLARLASTKPVKLVTGGATRAESVKRGLAAVPARVSVVLVHDGARPLVTRALVDRLLAAVALHGAAIPALAATDTLKCRTADGFVARTLDRSEIVCVQTPQAFAREVLESAIASAGDALAGATDCSGLVERTGARVAIVEGERENVKVTDPIDLAQVASRLAARPRVVAGSV